MLTLSIYTYKIHSQIEKLFTKVRFCISAGMNLQICFMNETSSDTESPSSESPSPSSAHTTTMKSKLPTPDPPKGLNFSQWVSNVLIYKLYTNFKLL